MEEVSKIETLTPCEAGRRLGKNAEFVRAGLRQNRFPFGCAVPPKKQGGRWNYIIIKSKFLEFIGLKEEKTNEMQEKVQVCKT
ncbi:MAG: hypothetical protein HFJ52_00315 [Clostridia bacterium]|nr:hypothetical protein [Clostridia bacterium]